MLTRILCKEGLTCERDEEFIDRFLYSFMPLVLSLSSFKFLLLNNLVRVEAVDKAQSALLLDLNSNEL